MKRGFWDFDGTIGFGIEEVDGKLINQDDDRELPFYRAGVEEIVIEFSCEKHHEPANLAGPEEYFEEYTLIQAHAMSGGEKIGLDADTQKQAFDFFFEDIEKYEEEG